ncbi:MAG: DUF58 domain-containing protein [Propionibacteriaceae bacterium]|jgi:uncharacterized protein (DUF58 family)|nr:DUF58 domain-containing protein [Propionibacteriaceae bacterium]
MAISGRVPLLLLLGLIPVVLWPAPWVVLAWAGLVAAVTLVDRALAVRPEALELARELPASVRLTERAQSSLTLTNPRDRAAALVVRDAWPPSAAPTGSRRVLRVRGGEAARLVTTLTPTRRGDLHAAAVTIRSFGPWRLGARQRHVRLDGTLRVLPEFRSRVHLPYRLARLREMDGQAAVHVRGQGTEFDSLREYQVGDDVRSIDWRASARAQKTMIRTWRPERDRHILLVLDTARWAAGRLGGGDTQVRLDAGIETCLLMGALGAASGDRLSLLAVDREVRARVTRVSGQGHTVAAFAQALSLVEPVVAEADWTLIAAQIGQVCSQRSLVILVTGLDPALYAEGLGLVLPTLAHDHRVVIAHVTDPGLDPRRRQITTATEAYDAAAADRLDLTTATLADRVGRLGVEVVTEPPDKLAPAVADLYLKLKATGRL